MPSRSVGGFLFSYFLYKAIQADNGSGPAVHERMATRRRAARVRGFRRAFARRFGFLFT